jgi:hypothetical protein
MYIRSTRLCLPLGLVMAMTTFTATAVDMKPMLFSTEKGIVEFDSEGEVIWKLDTGSISRDVWRLENGNILFPHYSKGTRQGGVREVNRAGETVWKFDTKGWALSCQRLPDGNTLIGASDQCALLVVTPKGEVVNRIKVKMQTPHPHSLTMARQLPNGNFIVAEETEKLIREYTPDGKVVWEYATPFTPFSVARLDNDNTIYSGQHGIQEISPDKEVVWDLTKDDVSDMGVRWFAGFQIMPNGNILIANAGGKVPFFEVNRDKDVVWESPLSTEEAGLGHGIYLTEFGGKVIR